MTEEETNIVRDTLQLWHQADDELTRWKDHYEELAKYFIPMKDNVYGSDNQGERKHNRLFDSTTVHSNEMLASMLHTLLSSPSQEFFTMTSGEPSIDREDKNRAWIQKTVRTLHAVINGTNYHSQAHEAFLDVGAFGMLVMRTEEDKDDIIRYKAVPCYNFSFIENDKGVIDTVFRVFEYTLTQLVEKFPEAIDSELMERATKFPLEKHKILHAVFPRKKYSITKKNRSNKKIASLYILLDKKLLLSNSGFDRQPYIITRWHVIAGETRGRGPAMKALPDARVLNALQKTVLKTAQKIADPSYLIPDDGVVRPFKTAPGSINYYRAGVTKDPLIKMDNDARPDFAENISEGVRTRIKKAFYVDQMLLKDGPQMTATEVIQRSEEQLRTLGPVQGRFTNEYLRPLVEDAYYYASKRGMIDEPPEGLAGSALQIKFKSTMARSQNMLEVENLNRMVGALAPFIQITPEVIDLLNPDQIVKYIFDLHGTPQELMRDGDEVDATRQFRNDQQDKMEQQQQQQQQAETTATEADAVSKLQQ